MKLEVLMSCMHQKDFSLVYESQIKSDVLVINQADSEEKIEKTEGKQRLRMITTRERGLSRSRNKAIRHSQGDICLICDDDEEFVRDYEAIVVKAFEDAPKADIIAFDLKNKKTRLKKKFQRIGYLGCLKIGSCQIAFRRRRVIEKNLYFEELMGSGSGNGAGEENKFLWDCLKAGLKVYYVPITIATLKDNTSVWFTGYDEKFFYQRGGSTRFMMGLVVSIVYGIYYLVFKYSMYKENISFNRAARALFQGIKENPIGSQKREKREKQSG